MDSRNAAGRGSTTSLLEECASTAQEIESYVEAHLFDPLGIMYSYVDSHTNRPFDRGFVTPIKVPRRAAFDPWAFWTYEDSILTTGLYIDGLILKYKVTGDEACLGRLAELWAIVKNVYACSQVHGIGCFLRPYGGYLGMSKWMEPLGTDQASPLFSGLYRYLEYADAETRADITRIMLQTLEWYEAQNFEYFYYKFFLHSYSPKEELSEHPNSYYLPAIAWAATVSGDSKWKTYLEQRLSLFSEGRYNICPAFCWGSDLCVLADIMGEEFGETFDRDMLEAGYQRCQEKLSEYDEPGTVKRLCPESADPDFVPGLDPSFDPEQGMGYAYFSTRHQGRARPRQEIDFLVALAALGYRQEEVTRQAVELLSHRRHVPADFTHWLADDYDRLPESVHIYARAVGTIMVEWWRNYWAIRNIEKAHSL